MSPGARGTRVKAQRGSDTQKPRWQLLLGAEQLDPRGRCCRPGKPVAVWTRWPAPPLPGARPGERPRSPTNPRRMDTGDQPEAPRLRAGGHYSAVTVAPSRLGAVRGTEPGSAAPSYRSPVLSQPQRRGTIRTETATRHGPGARHEGARGTQPTFYAPTVGTGPRRGVPVKRWGNGWVKSTSGFTS